MKTLLEQVQELAPLAAAATQRPWAQCSPKFAEAINTADDKLHVAMVNIGPGLDMPANAAFILGACNFLTPANLSTLAAALAAPVDGSAVIGTVPSDAVLAKLMRNMLGRNGFEFHGSDNKLINSGSPRSVVARREALELYAEIAGFIQADLSATTPVEGDVAGQWVSVKDRLPEVGQGVLLIGPHREGVMVGKLTDNGVGTPCWKLQQITALWGLVQFSHWMPLPTAPLTEKGETSRG